MSLARWLGYVGAAAALAGCGAILGIPDSVLDPNVGLEGGSPSEGGKPDGPVAEAGGDGATDGGDSSCGNTQTDPKNCGACGHDCLGGMCQGGECQPVLVASNTNLLAPYAMRLSGTNLVFTNLRGGTSISSVARVDKTATMGSITTLADYSTGYPQPMDGTPWAISVDGTSFWTAITSNGASGGKWGGGLDKCPIAGGCAAKTLAVPWDSSYAVDQDGANVFYGLRYDDMSFNTVYELRKAGLDYSSPTTMATLTDDVNAVAVDSSNVYYTMSYGNTGVYRCAKASPCSGMGTRITGGAIAAYAMALTTNEVYFVSDTSIERANKAGGGDTQIASNVTNPLGVSVDGVYVYFTDVGDTQNPATGQVVRCPLAGCGMGMKVLATGENPRPVVNDSAAVYWGTRTGKIYRLAK